MILHYSARTHEPTLTTRHGTGGSVHYLQGLVAKYLGVSLYFEPKPSIIPTRFQKIDKALPTLAIRVHGEGSTQTVNRERQTLFRDLPPPSRPRCSHSGSTQQSRKTLTRKERFSSLFPRIYQYESNQPIAPRIR
jgi:hypothetical protein